jgi:trehalose-6-phosphate synthase
MTVAQLRYSENIQQRQAQFKDLLRSNPDFREKRQKQLDKRKQQLRERLKMISSK